MARAIDWIVNEPPYRSEKPEGLRKFFFAADYIMGFAPDRNRAIHYQNIDIQWKSFYKEGAEIEKTLEHGFFKSLYVERQQREEIEGYIPSQRLILVHGLPGTGKTIVLRRIQENFKSQVSHKFIYVDIKANVKFPEAGLDNDFSSYFVRRLYNLLKKELIDSDAELLHKWLFYKIQFDDSYSEFREAIYDLTQKPLIEEEEWEDVLKDDKIRDKLFQLEILPSITTLISFIQSIHPLVLCIDNVDRLPLYDQRTMLETCIDLSNFAEVPIVLAIRDSNLRRISDTGALGDQVFLEKLERLRPTYVSLEDFTTSVQDQSSRGLSDAAISELLQKRLDFLTSRGALEWLKTPFTELLSDGLGKFQDYQRHFLALFKAVSKTFVDNDIYRFCNFNIRSLLLLYSRFIHDLLLQPDPGYPLHTLFPENKGPDITRLRNLFYRWLIFSDMPFSSVESEGASIPRMGYSTDFFLAYKILAYLYNQDRSSSVGIRFSQLAEDLERFDIPRDDIKRVVTNLAKDQNYNDSTTIWFDTSHRSMSDNSSRIFLMPSGRYFLDRFAVSREYAFWNILLTDFSEDYLKQLVGLRPIPYDNTLKDNFKIKLIFIFAKDVLLPATVSELDIYRQKLRVPTNWRHSNVEYYRSLFTVRKELYLTNLVTSVQASIPFANITEDERKKFEDEYQKLLMEIKESELEVSKN